jgi:hypothetical protein
MRLGHYQRGASIWMVLLFVIVLGFGAIFGLKLIPIYLEWFKIEKAINGALGGDSGSQPKNTIMMAITRRLDIDDVRRINELNYREYFTISKKGSRVTVDLAYEAREPLFYNLYIVAEFEKTFTN